MKRVTFKGMKAKLPGHYLPLGEAVDVPDNVADAIDTEIYDVSVRAAPKGATTKKKQDKDTPPADSGDFGGSQDAGTAADSSGSPTTAARS